MFIKIHRVIVWSSIDSNLTEIIHVGLVVLDEIVGIAGQIVFAELVGFVEEINLNQATNIKRVIPP